MIPLEHPEISHALRTGYPPQIKYPERDDVEVVEVSEEEFTEIISNRKSNRSD